MASSSLAIATRPEDLADALIARLADRPRFEGDGFALPPRLVVPNQGLSRWLELRIAGALGAAMHLESCFLEEGLWRTLAELDPEAGKSARLGREQLRQMVLAVLLGPGAAAEALTPLLAYARDRQGRLDPRKAWQLSGKLAGLLRDYSYHRPEFPASWLAGEEGGGEPLAAAQAALYRELFGPDGLRRRWHGARMARCATLPEYAAEVLRAPAHPPAGLCLWIFGTSQISPFHVDLLARLGGLMEVRLYLPSPLAGPLEEQGLTDTQRRNRFKALAAAPPAENAPPWSGWAGAGREALFLLASLLEDGRPFALEAPGRLETPPDNALGRLQASILGNRTDAIGPADPSLQIAACPGIQREVECARASILSNLGHDPDLRLSDIAVLVPDMARYRPTLQAVFERGPEPVPHALADLRAGEASRYGEALLLMLELAAGPFPRSQVFRLLLNPCLLAGTGLDREEVLLWNRWAETLGIRHSIDSADRQSRGYRDEELYTWRQGLRRLRLGRILSAPGGAGREWRGIATPAGLEGIDVDALSRFSGVVESLLEGLRGLAAPGLGCAGSAAAFGRFAAEFLAVPPDRPAEERVRRRMSEALDEFAGIEPFLELRGATGTPALRLLAECLRERLEEPEATASGLLSGGVTLAALQPARPIPFRIVYLLGLGEDGFAGGEEPGSLDLRARAARRGDVSPKAAAEFLFLEALLSARRKLYLSYDCLDPEKDRVLHPGTLLGALLDRLADTPPGDTPFRKVHIRPGAAELCLPADDACDFPAPPRGFERLLALEQGLRSGRIQVAPPARALIAEAARRASASLAAPPPRPARPPEPLRVAELAAFLRNPAEAALRRHLGLFPERELLEEDDEPFVTGRIGAQGIAGETVKRIATSTRSAPDDWRGEFEELYAARALASRAPEGAFAAIDRSRLARQIERRLGGPGAGLADLLASGAPFGPAALGEDEPGPGRLVFPGAKVAVAGAGTLTIHGRLPLVRRGASGLEYLVVAGRVEGKGSFHEALLLPLLFHLCLGGGEPARVFASHRDGLLRWRLQSFGPDRAERYLERLAAGLLGPDAFDLLPLALILQAQDLRGPLEADGDPEEQALYPGLLREALDTCGEDRFGFFRLPDLLAASSASVPEDAWAKIRARIGPLLEWLEPEEDGT